MGYSSWGGKESDTTEHEKALGAECSLQTGGLFVFFLVTPHGMWDLGSPTGDQTRAHCTARKALRGLRLKGRRPRPSTLPELQPCGLPLAGSPTLRPAKWLMRKVKKLRLDTVNAGHWRR